MRTDKSLPEKFRKAKDWKGRWNQETSFVVDDGTRRVNGQSGYERNRLFVNQGGERFHDFSAISGLDNVADGRGFALLDYDRDGWQDIVLVNANEPQLNLYRNEIDTLSGTTGHMIAIRFVGGNKTAKPSKFAPRNGVGAFVILDLDDDSTVKREFRIGEGFAAQNSATLIVGIGRHETVRSVTVRWPSGKKQRVEDVVAGTLLIAHEHPSRFESQPYAVAVERSQSPRAATTLHLRSPTAVATKATKLRVHVTMATWCAACKRHLPQLAALRAALPTDEVALLGVPTDSRDGPKKLDAYRAEHRPAYDLLTDLDRHDRQRVRNLLKARGADALPATIITDAQGKVLLATVGVPTVSEIRRLLR